MEDMRPEGIIGNEQVIVHDNLVALQEHLKLTNAEMAEILGVDKKYYERIKKNGGPLTYERLIRLHYICGVDLNRFVANNVDYEMYVGNKDTVSTDHYQEKIEDMIAILRSMTDKEERIEKLFQTYMRFGKYFKDVVTENPDSKDGEQ